MCKKNCPVKSKRRVFQSVVLASGEPRSLKFRRWKKSFPVKTEEAYFNRQSLSLGNHAVCSLAGAKKNHAGNHVTDTFLLIILAFFNHSIELLLHPYIVFFYFRDKIVFACCRRAVLCLPSSAPTFGLSAAPDHFHI